MIQEHKSDYTFTQTREIIEKHLPDIGFGVLNALDFTQTLETKGFPIPHKIVLLEICKPALAQNVMAQMSQMAYYLPCKVIIREVEGQVFAGFLSPKEEMVALGGPEVEVIAEAVEKSVKQVLQHIKNVL